MMTGDVPMAHAGMAGACDLQKQYYEEGKIYTLQIESTLKCPQKCAYCYADSKPDSIQGLTSGKIHELLNSAASLEIKMIDWLGGDPLVRSDWYELCNYATSLGLINNIWTSGIPLANSEIARQAVEVTKGGFISTHLDSLAPKFYIAMHKSENCEGDPKNIKLILKGIKNCLNNGKVPGEMVNCITYTATLADGDAKATILYFQKHFNIKTCLTLFNPVINRLTNGFWEPSLAQIKEAFSYRDQINYPTDFSCGSMDVSKFYCGTVICITAEGWLTPCSVIRTKEFGNINQEPFDLLLEKGKRRLLCLDFRDISKLPGNCGVCVNNSNCFGCRSSAFYYAGDLLAADPKCYQFTPQQSRKGVRE